MRGDPEKRLRTNDWRLLASIAGVSVRCFRDWRKEPDFPFGPDGTVGVLELCRWVDERRELAERDEVESGPGSPNLERLRAARASQEELKLSQMRGNVLPLPWVNAFLAGTAGVVREAGERLQRSGNTDGAHVLEECLGSLKERIERERLASGYRLECGDEDDSDRPQCADGESK